MNVTVRDDRIFPSTRRVAVVVVAVLLAASLTLYLWPDETERLFAWTIRPRMTPLVMGAGYFAGAFLFACVLASRRWHEVGLAFLPIGVFTAFMAVATILHWDRFNHGHVWFWMWVALYAVTPFLLPILWLRNRVTDPGTLEPDDARLPRPIRAVLALAGLVELAIGLFLFLWPEAAMRIWPWTLTPITARVTGGWFALPGVSALLMACDGRWSASRVVVLAGAVLAALILVGIARAWGDFDPSNPLTWVYAALIALTLLGFGALYLGMEAYRRRRRAANRNALVTLDRRD